MGLNRVEVFCNTEDQLVFRITVRDGYGFSLNPPLPCFLLEHSLTVTTTPIIEEPTAYDLPLPLPEIEEWVNDHGAW